MKTITKEKTRTPSTVDIVRGSNRAAALLHPLRIRILNELHEPDSASGLAKRLGLPRQRLNYHLRELEKQKLLEVVEERRKGNCVERLMQATARSYLISPDVLGGLAADPDQVRDRASSAYLVAAAARTIRDVATLREHATAAKKKLATFTLETEVRFATPDTRSAFVDELTSAVARLAAKYSDDTAAKGRIFRLVVGSYPKITKKLQGKAATRKEKR